MASIVGYSMIEIVLDHNSGASVHFCYCYYGVPIFNHL